MSMLVIIGNKEYYFNIIYCSLFLRDDTKKVWIVFLVCFG